jgi:hypothetical protein
MCCERFEKPAPACPPWLPGLQTLPDPKTRGWVSSLYEVPHGLQGLLLLGV